MPVYCDCESPELIEDALTSLCNHCGDVVPVPTANMICRIAEEKTRDLVDSLAAAENRVRELEQELADVNCQCRIAEGKIGVQSQMLKEAEDATCNAVGDLETAESRIKEYEKKLEKDNDRICGLLEDISGADNRILELEEKGKPTDHRKCVKCGGTEHNIRFYQTNVSEASVYRSEKAYGVCAALNCPDHEHLHITCLRCERTRWQHCADHVEDHVKAPSTCKACGADFELIAITQSSDQGLCPDCWTKGMGWSMLRK